MTAAEKKKYRAQQRRAAKGESGEPAKEAKPEKVEKGKKEGKEVKTEKTKEVAGKEIPVKKFEKNDDKKPLPKKKGKDD